MAATKSPAKSASKAKAKAPMKHVAKRDVAADVTASIIAKLEAGTRPWSKSWNTAGVGVGLPIRINGKPYNGINVLLLWMEAMTKGYTQRRWMTYNQAQKLGGQVRKGEKGTMIVKAGKFAKEVENPKKPGEMTKVVIPFMKPYTVFNICQIDNLPEKLFEKPTDNIDQTVSEEARIAEVEAFFAATGAKVIHGGDSASYTISEDVIRMPNFTAFHDAVAYYATLGHEIIHFTRHPSRLNREFGRKRYGDEGYAMEELVAELGAAFLCAELGISVEPREDHASYLAAWLKVLKSDNKAIFSAASHAQKACDFLYNLTGRVQPKGEDEEDEGEGAVSVEPEMMAA